MSEDNTYTFDKFMDDILVKEEQAKKKNVQKEESPAREYVKRYTERAGNRIRVGGVKK